VWVSVVASDRDAIRTLAPLGARGKAGGAAAGQGGQRALMLTPVGDALPSSVPIATDCSWRVMLANEPMGSASPTTLVAGVFRCSFFL